MDNPSSDTLGLRLNFEFAFNNANFSDRVLHIEIMAASSDSMSDSDGCDVLHKRAKLNSENEYSAVAEVKSFNISCSILAAHSPFFFKLFNNGMRESQEKDATLRINKSEDAALTELLKFMHNNTLSATTTPDLLDVLIIADRFEVTSCIRYCSVMLQKNLMSLESALLYLELPPSIMVAELVQPLIDEAKKCLVSYFKDINKTQEEAMTLPLSAVEVVLSSSDSLQVESKDEVFEFILKWARAQYPELGVRRKIVSKRLAELIPFTSMSYSKLKQVLVCPDFEHEQVSKLVLDALFFKAKLPYEQSISSSKKCRLIKLEQYELAQPRCIVHFDIKKEELANLGPLEILGSPSFNLGGRWFEFRAKYYSKEEKKKFGLFLKMTRESESCTVDYEYAVINKSSKEFQEMRKGNFNDSELRSSWGYDDLFEIPWIDMMSKDSDYFIDGILHLRADLTINNSS